MSNPIRPEIRKLQANIERVIKGKPDVIKSALIGVLAQGHILFEDVPGVGKTTLAHLIARSLNLSFARIQFTSDMLPSDILGVTTYDPNHHRFEFRPGPLFSNVVLADEINRTTPKTQSALLEAMNTGEVSMDKETHRLPKPFMVLATQNPIEFHGTFPLPKSQMDRFLLRLQVGYPDPEEEAAILRDQRDVGSIEHIQPVMTGDELLAMQEEVKNVRVSDELIDYIVRIVNATRQSRLIELGVSTRGSLALRRAAQARAYYEGRDYCTDHDVKAMVRPVCAHRLQVVRTFDNDGLFASEEEAALDRILHEIETPA